MLPSSWPPTTTVSALTCPVRCAPASIVRLPCTLTSPLKRPAIRTCPLPSILPSIGRSAAITDSFGSTAVRGCSRARRVSALNGTAVGLSASRTEGSRDEVGVVPPVVEACSFQRAITESSPCLERKRPDGKPPRPLGQIEFVSDCADALARTRAPKAVQIACVYIRGVRREGPAVLWVHAPFMPVDTV